ncbi:hypothetical protein [Vreelandella sulfidaeris]|uniref:hypothetical protein n=1 Tax=Vreelandella sulfidaeris TaxID=115553 RepID=UPI0035E77E47
MRLYNIGHSTDAMPYLRQAAEAGDVEAMYYMGESERRQHMLGMTTEAMEWYPQALVKWELSEMVLPTPMLDQYEAYSEEDHGVFPERNSLTVANPFEALIRYFGKDQEPQYWYTEEFQV